MSPINRQPVNTLPQWSVTTDDGQYVGVQDGGLIASRAILGEIQFEDGTTQTTAPSSATLQIQNGNAGSFYLPLLPNPTAPYAGIVILDAPSGYISIQADGGAGASQGGFLNLQSSNGPFSAALAMLSDGSGGNESLSLSPTAGVAIQTGSTILIANQNGYVGALYTAATGTLAPQPASGAHPAGHILADMIFANTPASSSATGITNQVSWDSNYLYVCVAANTWKRVALASF
jgi:hypothetical protein